MNRKVLLLMAALSGLMATTACIVEEPHPHAVYVAAPPPAPIVEVQPPAPTVDAFWEWQPGHWRWDGNHYYWHKGQWGHRPAYSHGWVAPHWEPHSSGYVFVEGHW